MHYVKIGISPLCPFLVLLIRNTKQLLPRLDPTEKFPRVYPPLMPSCSKRNCAKWNTCHWERESIHASIKWQRSKMWGIPEVCKGHLHTEWKLRTIWGNAEIRTPPFAMGPIDAIGFLQFYLPRGFRKTNLCHPKCRALTLLAYSVPFWMYSPHALPNSKSTGDIPDLLSYGHVWYIILGFNWEL